MRGKRLNKPPDRSDDVDRDHAVALLFQKMLCHGCGRLAIHRDDCPVGGLAARFGVPQETAHGMLYPVVQTTRVLLPAHALDVVGPGCVYVLDTRRSSPTYAQRVAGPFAQEHAANEWIAARLRERMHEPQPLRSYDETVEDARQYLADAAAADTHSSDVDPGRVDPWEER